MGAPLYHHAQLLRLKLPKYCLSSDTSQRGQLQPRQLHLVETRLGKRNLGHRRQEFPLHLICCRGQLCFRQT